MSSRLVKWLTVVSLTFVLGGHWAVLQSVAWMTMVAGYSQTEPLTEAVVRTFDGKHPCQLCLMVAREKKSEQKQDSPKSSIKIDFFLTSDCVKIFPPAPEVFPRLPLRSLPAQSETPPKPPPRILQG